MFCLLCTLITDGFTATEFGVITHQEGRFFYKSTAPTHLRGYCRASAFAGLSCSERAYR